MHVLKKIIINRWSLLLIFIGLFFIFSCKFYDFFHRYQETISSFAIVYTAIIAIWDFYQKRNFDKLNYSIKLIEYFDNKELRLARTFTRNLKGPIESGAYSKNVLLAFIENWDSLAKKKLKALRKLCNCQNSDQLKDSLIFLFNYWQKIYTAIEYEAVNKEYLLHHVHNVYREQYERFKFWLDFRLGNGGDNEQYADLQKFYDLVIAYERIKSDKKFFKILLRGRS